MISLTKPKKSILLNKISRRFLLTTKLFSGWKSLIKQHILYRFVSYFNLSVVFKNTYLFSETKVLLWTEFSGIINCRTFSSGDLCNQWQSYKFSVPLKIPHLLFALQWRLVYTSDFGARFRSKLVRSSKYNYFYIWENGLV